MLPVTPVAPVLPVAAVAPNKNALNVAKSVPVVACPACDSENVSLAATGPAIPTVLGVELGK